MRKLRKARYCGQSEPVLGKASGVELFMDRMSAEGELEKNN